MKKTVKKVRLFNIFVHDGYEWVLMSVQETGEKAMKAKDFYMQQGCRSENVKITQDK